MIPSAGAAVTEAEAGVADAERQVQYAAAEAKGAAARAKLEREFSPARMAEAHLRLYRELDA